MNKTININLGGIFFHIDEDAYLKLKHYLDAVSGSLQDDSQAKDEIINDIEQRISEIFTEKITKERQVIHEKDVDDVIAIMGQPEDYRLNEENYESNTSKNNPVKKLYRYGKNRILGGVSSGMAMFFNVEVVWVRVLWVILAIISSGVGALIYLIFWMLLPEAKTTAEELQLKGEPITINSIEKKIKNEYAKVEDNLKSQDYSDVRDGFQQLIDTFIRIIKAVFKILVMFLGGLLIFIAAVTILALIVSLFGVGTAAIMGNSYNFLSYPEFFDTSVIPKWILGFAFIIAILIPFVFLLVLGLNIMSDKKISFGKNTNLSLLGVWLLSLFTLGFAGIEFGKQFSNTNEVTFNQTYNVQNKDTLYIRMLNNNLISKNEDFYRTSDLEEVKTESGDERLFYKNVSLDIRRSDNSEMLIKIVKSAYALSKEKAYEKAQNIDYQYSLNENKLNLNAYFLTLNELKYNRPKVEIIVYIPENKVVYLDNTTRNFLDNVSNVQDIYDGDMPNHYYQMKPEGFYCLDCKEITSNDDKNTDNQDSIVKPDEVKIDINTNGINVSVNDGKDKAKVKIDENGMEIR